MLSLTPFAGSNAPFLPSTGVGVSPRGTRSRRAVGRGPAAPQRSGCVRTPGLPRANFPNPRALSRRAGPPSAPTHRGCRQAADALAQRVQVDPPPALRPPGPGSGGGGGGRGSRGRGGCGRRAGLGRPGRAPAAVPAEPGQGALSLLLGAGLQVVGAQGAEGLGRNLPSRHAADGAAAAEVAAAGTRAAAATVAGPANGGVRRVGAAGRCGRARPRGRPRSRGAPGAGCSWRELGRRRTLGPGLGGGAGLGWGRVPLLLLLARRRLSARLGASPGAALPLAGRLRVCDRGRRSWEGCGPCDRAGRRFCRLRASLAPLPLSPPTSLC